MALSNQSSANALLNTLQRYFPQSIEWQQSDGGGPVFRIYPIGTYQAYLTHRVGKIGYFYCMEIDPIAVIVNDPFSVRTIANKVHESLEKFQAILAHYVYGA